MNKKLYNLMDWAAIEEIVYGEASNPEKLLGAHIHGKSTLIQAFFPGATDVSIIIKGQESQPVLMDKADDAGFFAALIASKDKFEYSYSVTMDDNGSENIIYNEAYSDYSIFDSKIIKSFFQGKLFDAYKYFGAHLKTVNGIKGYNFAVYAPYALRVSLVGDFNNFNPKFHQMKKIHDSGIFEIFIPNLKDGEAYKFNMLLKGNEIIEKCDPYSFSYDLTRNVSLITEDLSFKNSRNSKAKFNKDSYPLNIYELSLNNFYSFEGEINVEELADRLIKYIKDMGYTHIELLPLLENAGETSPYDVSGFFAANSKLPGIFDLSKFTQLMHKASIGVIMQMPIASFKKSAISFDDFSGNSLYEYDNPYRAIDGKTGRSLFNYAKAEVTDLIMSSCLYWVDALSLDGIKIPDIASMIYLDYYKNNGQWEANINGGNEHIEAIEFLKMLNSTLHQNYPNIITIAENLSDYAFDTDLNSKDSLGFDYTVNYKLHNDLLKYITTDPIKRKSCHNLIAEATDNFTKERVINGIYHFDVDESNSGLMSILPGCIEDRFANFRVLLGLIYSLPNKKSVFMGQDIGEFDTFDYERKLQWNLLDFETHTKFNNYLKALFDFYKSNGALFEKDFNEDTFKWINNSSNNSNVFSFLRYGDNSDDFILVVANFANRPYEKYKIGVPFVGKYKEVFTSDLEEFGGQYKGAAKVYLSKENECDSFNSCIRLNLAALSINFFKFTAYTEGEIKEINKIKSAKEKKIKDRIKANETYLKEKALIREKLKKELNKEMSEALDKVTKIK